MGYQAVFKRYEIKYMITAEQKERILRAMEPYMEPDRFGRSTIRNIYYDTDDHILARHSIAKPDFKEKLRIRSYSQAEADSTVFVELKRKCDHVVYKRRLGLPEKDAMKWMAGSKDTAVRSEAEAESAQVAGEIDYFLGMYNGLRPALYLSYDREAYRMRAGAGTQDGGADFRVTFDENILCRDSDMSLCSAVYGERILDEGRVLMELKCSGGIPMWMTDVLSAERIYKTSFSKYGTAYQSILYPSVAAESAERVAERVYRQESMAREQRARSTRRRSAFGFSHRRATA